MKDSYDEIIVIGAIEGILDDIITLMPYKFSVWGFSVDRNYARVIILKELRKIPTEEKDEVLRKIFKRLKTYYEQY